jgi:transposase
MMHIAGHDRSQLLLLPESLDDYVGPENPVRFIEAFVDGLDLTAAGFARVTPKRTGRPGYAPTDLLKLYIYGYLNRIRSSRRLEAETHRNIEVIWLLRHLKPDFKTIADFRRDNRKAFRPVFRQFVLLCRQLDLFGRELLAVDGTRIKAVNNKDRTSPAPHCPSSSSSLMPSLTITFSVSIRVMPLKAKPLARGSTT